MTAIIAVDNIELLTASPAPGQIREVERLSECGFHRLMNPPDPSQS